MEHISPASLPLTGRKQRTEVDMSMNFAKLGEQKVTVPIALLVGLLIIGWQAKDFTIDGLDEFFVSEAEGGELVKAIEEIGTKLDSYIDKSEIREVNDQMQEVESQITETQLWIAANGGNEIATARLDDLMKRRDKLTERKGCLLNANILDKETCYVE
jgi:hypothetical protein